MSRAYKIPISESASETIVGRDGVSSQLDLIGLLPPERMGALLLDSLRARGFENDPCGTSVSKVVDGVTIRTDGSGLVTAEIELKQEAEVTVDTSIRWDTDYDTERHRERRDKAIEEAKEKAQSLLARKLQSKQEALATEATARLEGVLRSIKSELDAAVLDTTKTALIEKAASIGEIVEQTEGQNGDITLRVRV